MNAKGVMQSLCTYPDEAHLITEKKDKEAARIYGERRAAEGLGHRSILTMTDALRQVCRESANPGAQRPATGRYVNAFLEGHMVGREASVLQEQARTMRALQRARVPRTNTRPL
jgi:hypothetical protein